MKYVDKTYIRLVSSYLDRFKETSSEVYNFRCPYCGDSDKSRTLARAYLFESDDTYLFKCHNCGHPTNLQQFIKDQSFSLYTEYRKDKLLSRGKPKPEPTVKIDTSTIKTNNGAVFSVGSHVGNKIIKSLDNADIIGTTRDYLYNRDIPRAKVPSLYHVANINYVTQQIPKYKDKKFMDVSAIAIPFIDADGIVTHIQFRMFEGTMRYMTLECETGAIKIFGLDTVDKNKMVYVFEGPFDSMFCNGIALANGSLHTFIPYLNKHFKNYTLVYDKDLVSNKDILASLKKSIVNGCNVLLYDTVIIDSDAKDLNDMVSDGLITDTDSYLLNNTYKGFKATMYLDRIKQIDKHASPFSM